MIFKESYRGEGNILYSLSSRFLKTFVGKLLNNFENNIITNT
jgi:hypothetical protein